MAVGDKLAAATEDRKAAAELLEMAEGADADEMRADIDRLGPRIDELSAELQVLLLPPDPNDNRNCIVEIRGTEGGDEANLFAGDLFEMYKNFASMQGWKLEMMGASHSDRGGFSEISFTLAGGDVWRRMQHEAGTHRVQRVPVTESKGRVHTSSATVSVLAEAKEVEVDIAATDLKIDTYRASGPGGQSVNTTDSAVRVTHLPTGTVVSMQDEKSQIQNREKALRVLRARILEAERARQAAERSETRRDQTGSGGRADKIRTYNFKENRVSDHRVDFTLYALERVLAGDLTEVSDKLVEAHIAEALRAEEG